MDKQKLSQYLNYIGTSITNIVGDWAMLSCPLSQWTHEKGKDTSPSCGIKLSNPSVVHCFACSFAGDLYDLAIRLNFYGATVPPEAFKLADEDQDSLTLTAFDFSPESVQKEELTEFPDWWLSSFPALDSSPEGLSYVLGRGLAKKTAKALDMRWDGHRSRVCFPIRDYQGVLRGLHGRLIIPETPDNPAYRMYTYQGKNNPIVWHGEDSVNSDLPVVVVESVFDRAAVYQVYKNVICPLTASLSPEKVLRLRNMDIYHIVTLFDADKAGREARKFLVDVLKPKIYYHIDLPNGEDPGQQSYSNLVEILDPYIG